MTVVRGTPRSPAQVPGHPGTASDAAASAAASAAACSALIFSYADSRSTGSAYRA
ncbi:hypothetical protein AB0I68_31760 [Streptomyces sp. NPDC050448]|uniref:hypothetical protein n=1 Tax=Streptomyces sp. NPDC050448 TaxID=3155404 RepID=UPI00342428C5